MDKKIVVLLSQYEMLEEEIEQCFNLCPGLEIVDVHKAQACINLLIERGYPKEDIGLLLAVNPAILMYEPDSLATKLVSIHGDIEEILKTDPFVI